MSQHLQLHLEMSDQTMINHLMILLVEVNISYENCIVFVILTIIIGLLRLTISLVDVFMKSLKWFYRNIFCGCNSLSIS